MIVQKKPTETDQQLINRFNRLIRSEGILEDWQEKQFFMSEKDKRKLKTSRREGRN